MKLVVNNSDINEINGICSQMAEAMRMDIYETPQTEHIKIGEILYQGRRLRDDSGIEIAQIIYFAGFQTNGESAYGYRVFIR